MLSPEFLHLLGFEARSSTALRGGPVVCRGLEAMQPMQRVKASESPRAGQLPPTPMVFSQIVLNKHSSESNQMQLHLFFFFHHSFHMYSLWESFPSPCC